jgi:hypothetical protein
MKCPATALLLMVLLFRLSLLHSQTVPAPTDSSIAGSGSRFLPIHNPVPVSMAKQTCLQLPLDPENGIQGPHGDSLISSSCRVTSLAPVDSVGEPHWMVAHYDWTSLYTAEDSIHGADARDTVTQEEVVLFRTARSGLIPVWHERFETGNYAVLRSVTPELAPARGGTLLSVMECVNGTGGCGQDFLLRHPDGRWSPVTQAWLDQLPRGYKGRIRHGVRIDPKTLRGDAGFYGDRDPNCCPSQNLIVHLTIRGDSLVLLRQAVRPIPNS